MRNMPVAIALSPNTSGKDVRAAIQIMLRPGQWRNGPFPRLIERWFQGAFQVADAITFDSGRSSLLCILKALDVGAGDEVLLQAYTCVAVPNAVIWCGATPHYVDIAQGTFNIDVQDLERKITSRTKAVIVQHTFGHPAPLHQIQSIAERHRIFVIEDCAHALGSTYEGKLVGTFGDAAFFSFGRDKVISSVHGGIAVTNNPNIGNRLRSIQDKLNFPHQTWIAQQLFHPIALSAIIPLYYEFSIGKVLLVLLQRLRLLSLAVTPEERYGGKPSVHPSRLPNALAALALAQLQQLDELNAHRQKIRRLYDDVLQDTGLELPSSSDCGGIYLRYTLKVPDPERLRRVAREHKVMLGDWYNVPVAPAGTNFRAVGYSPGDCPMAEETAKLSINLPTHRKVDESHAAFIARLVRQEVKSSNGT